MRITVGVPMKDIDLAQKSMILAGRAALTRWVSLDDLASLHVIAVEPLTSLAPTPTDHRVVSFDENAGISVVLQGEPDDVRELLRRWTEATRG